MSSATKKRRALPTIEFVGRARVRDSEISRQRRWASTCRRFAIVEVRSKIETNNRGRPLVYWLAIRTLGDSEFGLLPAVGHYRSRESAERACVERAFQEAEFSRARR